MFTKKSFITLALVSSLTASLFSKAQASGAILDRNLWSCRINTGKGLASADAKSKEEAIVAVINECYAKPKSDFYYRKEYVCIEQNTKCSSTLPFPL